MLWEAPCISDEAIASHIFCNLCTVKNDRDKGRSANCSAEVQTNFTNVIDLKKNIKVSSCDFD